MVHCFVINPNAGYIDCSGCLKAEIEVVFKIVNEPYEIYYTTGNKDDIEFLQNRCEKGDNIRFYACGGDGTMHDVLNGIYQYSNVSFAVIPCGTGNDYVKSIGGYKNLLDLVQKGTETSVDLIKVNETVSANIVSLGFDAKVNENTVKHKKTPILKNIAYYLGVLESLFGKLGYDIELSINDGEYVKKKILLLASAKGQYYGKTFYAAPLAKVNDGKIDICVVEKVSIFRIAKLISIYQSGKHVNNQNVANVITYKKVDSIKIKSSDNISLSIDGELAKGKEIDIKILPKAVKLFSLFKD